MTIKTAQDLIVVRLTRYLGASFRRMRGADDRTYINIVAWYPRAWRRLGYAYASLPWFTSRSDTFVAHS